MNIVFCLSTPHFIHLKPIMEQLNKSLINNIYILIFNLTNTLSSLNYTINDILIQVKHFDKILIIDNIKKAYYFYINKNINYTFFNTPYEDHFYKNIFTNISKHSKIIGIPYGIDPFGEVNDLCWYNRDFITNCYTYCIDIEENILLLNNYLDKNKIKKYNIIDIGFCKLEYLRNTIYETNEKQILISFRWTKSETQIMFYEDYFINLCKQNKDIKICYRPHPASHKNYCNSQNNNKLLNVQLKNLIIDYSFDIKDAYANSIFFIIDYSSIMVEYMLVTKKPVIYLYSPLYKFNKIGQISLEVMYIAHNIDELNNIIFDLLNGNDYKKNIREEYVNIYYRNDNSTNKLIDYMLSNV